MILQSDVQNQLRNKEISSELLKIMFSNHVISYSLRSQIFFFAKHNILFKNINPCRNPLKK